MANISAIELKMGYVVNYNNGKWRVISTEHVKPGKGGAFMQVELRNIKTGTKTNERFRSEDKVDRLIFETIDAQFSFANGQDFTFLRLDSYEEVILSKDLIGKNSDFLIDSIKVKLEYADDEIVGIEFPDKLTLKVIETEPQIKGATATNVNKQAKMSNGITILVPSFIAEGEELIVRIEDRQYVERA